MRKLIIVAVLVVSFQSIAGPWERSAEAKLTFEATSSKSQAYEHGNKTLQELKQLKGRQVYQRLNLFDDDMLIRSLKIDEGYVEVHEFHEPDGTLKYRAKLQLIYSYRDLGDHHNRR